MQGPPVDHTAPHAPTKTETGASGLPFFTRNTFHTTANHRLMSLLHNTPCSCTQTGLCIQTYHTPDRAILLIHLPPAINHQSAHPAHIYKDPRIPKSTTKQHTLHAQHPCRPSLATSPNTVARIPRLQCTYAKAANMPCSRACATATLQHDCAGSPVNKGLTHNKLAPQTQPKCHYRSSNTR
jgi:hypothetical protein